jgi:hypothetical protein
MSFPRPRSSANLRALALLCLLGCVALLAGCVGLSLKDPGVPMSQRDLGLRLRTREFAATFAGSVAVTADGIRAASTNKMVQADTIRWKLGAGGAIRQAALSTDPVLALAEIWTLSSQMTAFFEDGAGTNLLGNRLPEARARSRELLTNAVELAHQGLSAGEFSQMEKFVTAHVARHPIADISFEREPVSAHWKGFGTEKSTAGTTPEAVADLAGRAALVSQQLRDEAKWRIELAGTEWSDALERTERTAESLDATIRRIAAVSETAVPAVTSAVARAGREFQAGLDPAVQRIEMQWSNTVTVLRQEREALMRNISAERAALVKAVGEQRSALLQELDRTARAVTDKAAAEMRRAVQDIALYAILFVLVLLGLPFGFGFIAGRAAGRSRTSQDTRTAPPEPK